MSSLRTEQKTYECPICHGQMLNTVIGKRYDSYECESCKALLMIDKERKYELIKVNNTEFFVSNPEVAKILKKEIKQ
jgi:ribosomal protein L37AE/L43A